MSERIFGSELLRLVEVMDRLRSPGGCAWDAEQTHESLIKYLLEESYEFIDAIETDDRQGMREELGDVLLQVYFHSRIAQDHATDPFTIDDVAGAIADKLIGRHPHVFGDVQVNGTEEIIDNWEQIKAAEKDGTSLKINQFSGDKATEESVGEALASVISWAYSNDIDPELALRAKARAMVAEILAAEAAR